MRCSNCPVLIEEVSCLGETIPRLCVLASTRQDYRNQLVRLADAAPIGPARREFDLDAVLAAIACCADRGPVLPRSLQPECGCAELTECLRGLGEQAGRVTLQDCIRCIVGR